MMGHMAHEAGLRVLQPGTAIEPFPALGHTQNWQASLLIGKV